MDIQQQVAMGRLGCIHSDIDFLSNDCYANIYHDTALSAYLAQIHNEHAEQMYKYIEDEITNINKSGVQFGEYLYFGEPEELREYLNNKVLLEQREALRSYVFPGIRDFYRQLYAERAKQSAEYNYNQQVEEKVRLYYTEKPRVPPDFDAEEAMRLQEKKDAKLRRLRELPALEWQRQQRYYAEQREREERRDRAKSEHLERKKYLYAERVQRHQQKVSYLRAVQYYEEDKHFALQQQYTRDFELSLAALEAKQAARTKQLNDTKNALSAAGGVVEHRQRIETENDHRGEEIIKRLNQIDERVRLQKEERKQQLREIGTRLDRQKQKVYTFKQNQIDQQWYYQMIHFHQGQARTQRCIEKQSKLAQQRISDHNAKVTKKHAQIEHRIKAQYARDWENQQKQDYSQREARESFCDFKKRVQWKKFEIDYLRMQLEHITLPQKRAMVQQEIDLKISQLYQIE